MSEQNTPKKPKKKSRPRYIDDGRTIADMTPVDGARGKRPASSGSGRPRASFKDQFRTYIESVKMMFVPMLVTMGIITAAFLIFWLLTG